MRAAGNMQVRRWEAPQPQWTPQHWTLHRHLSIKKPINQLEITFFLKKWTQGSNNQSYSGHFRLFLLSNWRLAQLRFGFINKHLHLICWLCFFLAALRTSSLLLLPCPGRLIWSGGEAGRGRLLPCLHFSLTSSSHRKNGFLMRTDTQTELLQISFSSPLHLYFILIFPFFRKKNKSLILKGQYATVSTKVSMLTS